MIQYKLSVVRKLARVKANRSNARRKLTFTYTAQFVLNLAEHWQLDDAGIEYI